MYKGFDRLFNSSCEAVIITVASLAIHRYVHTVHYDDVVHNELYFTAITLSIPVVSPLNHSA